MTLTHDELRDEQWAAEVLGVTTRTLANWRWASRGPTHIKVGRKVWYTEAAVNAYLATCVVEPR